MGPNDPFCARRRRYHVVGGIISHASHICARSTRIQPSSRARKIGSCIAYSMWLQCGARPRAPACPSVQVSVCMS